MRRAGCVMSEVRDIFLRAHTVKVRDGSTRGAKKATEDKAEKWPERALIFDTETRTTVDQTLILGFNLPFDLSRISRGWRTSRKRGFSLIMSNRFWRQYGYSVPDPYRPEIRIEAKDARTAFISRGKTIVPAQWTNTARFLDVS